MPQTPPPSEAHEARDALLTFAPAVLAAFVLDWALRTRLAWEPRRALVTAAVFGIVLALVLQRAIARARR